VNKNTTVEPPSTEFYNKLSKNLSIDLTTTFNLNWEITGALNISLNKDEQIHLPITHPEEVQIEPLSTTSKKSYAKAFDTFTKNKVPIKYENDKHDG